MALRASSLEEDITCSVCYEVFRDPVVLECSHSFCRSCLDRTWDGVAVKLCPVCRQRCNNVKPPANLALRNIAEAYVREHEQRQDGGETRCSLHGERLLLYCTVDKEPLCLVCQVSRRHRDHRLCPVEEAAQELKSQAGDAERQIRREFEELRHFLRLEESARIADLRDEADLKSVIMREKLDHLSRKIESLALTISQIEQDVRAGDVTFLQAYKGHLDRIKTPVQDPVLVSDSLIDMAKHLGNLKFKVWKKMKERVQYNPVILDPNTAAPWLSLSGDLSSVSYGTQQLHIPDNPERCDVCVCVLGSEPLGKGRHSWEVDVGKKTKWDLGVAKESAGRKGILNVNSNSGFWAIALREGSQYSACTQPWTRLQLKKKKKPRKIRVCLNYDFGEVSFYDSADMTLIYTFKESFTEKLIPFFSPCIQTNFSAATSAEVTLKNL
ncbi:nuclear factor 7, brain-like [Chanos chanos]|uniref:Nuclear factor 7, brain-like n=1 Tax=Chanos chanos TaxID=29144 RepID=A0A6J2V923_CHACN|nr:nuclear factor 7, brain-like [Chanos chanos]